MPPLPIAGAVPVSFDDHVADLLIEELERLARTLCGVALTSSDGAAGARHDWRGFTRNWFDREHEALVADLRSCAGDALRTAELVRQAKAEAAVRQTQLNAESLLRQADQRRWAALVEVVAAPSP